MARQGGTVPTPGNCEDTAHDPTACEHISRMLARISDKWTLLVVRSLGTVWGILNQHSLDGFKSWVQNHAPAMAQGVYSFLALPGWAATGVLGVILAFVFGRRLGPE